MKSTVKDNLKIGVFICDCGTEIASYLHTEALATAAGQLPQVAVSQRMRYLCSRRGLTEMQEAIRGAGLNRIVVAACTPRTHEAHLRSACQEAGLNSHLLEMVNIREGCAWVHQADGEAAMAKALALVRAGVARASLLEPYEGMKVQITPSALVIGGGIAGMTAALALAERGIPVKLIEKEHHLGGLIRNLHTLYPTGQRASEFLNDQIEALRRQPNVEILVDTRVSEVAGSIGNYYLVVTSGGNDRIFDVGAIIVATGAQVRQPYGLFRYGTSKVMTQLELESVLAKGDLQAEQIVMILCAGSRDERTPYCSGICCMTALKQALLIKESHPEVNLTLVFRDLYPKGDNPEEDIRKAKQLGVDFIQYGPEAEPRVTAERVEVYDLLTKRQANLPYDSLILATPLVPQKDVTVLASRLKIPLDSHGFSPDVRFRLRPGDHVERGIYVCGAAHYPSDIQETTFQASSAAARAFNFLRQNQVVSEGPVAVVDTTLCTGCGSCVEICPFQAINLKQQDSLLSISIVDPLLCKGCGLCAPTCLVKAISLQGSSDPQLMAQIKALLSSEQDRSKPLILGLFCEWSAYAAAELAGARRLQYPPHLRIIPLRCAGRIDPYHILWAFLNGADGVLVGGCPPGKCHYVNGNQQAEKRVAKLIDALAARGFEIDRLRLKWFQPDDASAFVEEISIFAAQIEDLGPRVTQDRRWRDVRAA